MNGMQFSSTLITALAWPLIILSVLIVYRGWITTNISSGKFKLGPVEFEWFRKIDTAGQDVGDALKEMPPDSSSDGPVPTSLVDLIGDINNNSRIGIRKAFRLVRKALDNSYPEVASVTDDRLSDAMRDLVRRGVLHPEVQSAISQLQKLLDMSDSNGDMANRERGYLFLLLAEGAIHGILRSAKIHASELNNARLATGPAPISFSWRGLYDQRFIIELLIDKWISSTEFEGEMNYPDSDTVTSITGYIITKTPAIERTAITWQEKGYVRGNRPIDFDGDYKATVSGNTMTGAWYKGDRRVAEFMFEAT